MSVAPTHLILSLDYEIFGNGSGNLDCCVLRPTERIARIAERHGARLEVFVDALEFDAMERHAQPGIDEVRRQLQDLLARGHQLQLHLHPQWHAQAAPGKQGWHLDAARWRIGSLDSSAAQECIERGYQWLAALTAAVDSAQRPRVFRAGGWAIQPSAAVLPLLQALNITLESSVAPGMVNRRASDWFDFRRVPDSPSWPIADDVCASAPAGAMREVPIAVGRINRLHHLQQLRRSRGRLAEGCCGSYDSGASRWQKLGAAAERLLHTGQTMLDFSVLDGSALIAVARHWMQRWHADAPVPLVAIGHSKNFSHDSAAGLDQFLRWAVGQPGCMPSTYVRFASEC
jgi:hypothetical protein